MAAAASRRFTNEVGNEIEVDVVLGRPDGYCLLSIASRHSCLEGYVTRMELERVRDVLNEVLPPPDGPEFGLRS